MTRRRQITEETAVAGNGYDDAELAERRHPTRNDLDRISRRHPVLIARLSSQCLLTANSAALEQVNYAGDTPQPRKVLIRHDASSEP